jgi:hypothetical protein
VPRLALSTSLRGDSTVYRGIRLWNVLPSAANSCRGMSMFKREARRLLSASEASSRTYRPHQHHQLCYIINFIKQFNQKTIRDVGQSVAIGDKHFEVVKEFVYFYLGSLMTPTNDVSLAIQRRIQTAFPSKFLVNSLG